MVYIVKLAFAHYIGAFRFIGKKNVQILTQRTDQQQHSKYKDKPISPTE